MCPQNEIQNWPSGGGGILLPVPILTTVIFQGHSSVSFTKVKKIAQQTA